MSLGEKSTVFFIKDLVREATTEVLVERKRQF